MKTKLTKQKIQKPDPNYFGKYEEHYIKSDLFTTYVRTYGDFHCKTPLIILHGGPGGNIYGLEPLLYLYKKYDIPIIIYNQHGSTFSNFNKDFFDLTEDEFYYLYSIKSFEDELLTITKYFNLKSYYLLGHSWGGALALDFAVNKNPAELKKIISFSGLCSSKEWEKYTLKLAKEILTDEEYDLLIESKNIYSKVYERDEVFDELEKIYSEFLNKYNKNKVNYVFKYEKTDDWMIRNDKAYDTMWGYSEIFATGNLKDFDITERLSEIKIPTLILNGRNDESSVELNKLMHEKIPNSKWVIFEKSAHSAYVCEPKKVNKVIAKFLKKPADPKYF